MRLAWPLLGTLLLAVAVHADTDYYKVLGVEKDADDRTIRKAFKKLAIKMHPDKNTGNPSAHDEFVKINKAYEVLKDEELRKKYDQYGEKGLEDGFQGGNNYQSWQFYNDNFGIYDDDQEIVTLNRADFQRLVSDSNEMWFINFYSTYCSHCHELAPAWRKFAREMEGSVRIGAVNCAEDPMLCQSQRVNAYPSLVMYPSGEFYRGIRDVDNLVDFVMQRMSSEVLHLNSENVAALSDEWEPYNSRAWVVDFCDETESCLTSQNRRKLAAMLDGLVNVGSIDCTRNAEAKLCEKLGRNEGVVYFPMRDISRESAKVISSLDPKEITETVIAFLDHLEEIDEQELEELFGENGAQFATAVWFVPSRDSLDKFSDYRRIPSSLPDFRILYADCSKFGRFCQEHLDSKKLPQFVVFKPTGGYEIDYVNKAGFREAVAFIRESATSPLHALNEHTYSEAVSSGELWIVDYFAPWCPPCMKLMAEYRRFHATVDTSNAAISKVNIASIDCQKYPKICQDAGVQSYPTSILYSPDGKQHRMAGFHGVQAVVEFIDNALNPAVDELTPEDFEELVTGRADDVTWVVDFFAPWCGPCQQLAPELQKAARKLKAFDERVKVGSVDCQAYGNFCREKSVTGYPLVRLYPAKAQKTPRRAKHYEYPQNMWRNADSIERWVFGLLPSLVTPLGNDFWTSVLDSDEPYLVDFFAPWCGHCVQFAPSYEQIAKELDGKVKVAKVDCDQWPGVCQGAQIQAYPTIRFFRGRKGSSRQNVWGIQLQAQRDSIIHVVRQQLPSLFQHDEL